MPRESLFVLGLYALLALAALFFAAFGHLRFWRRRLHLPLLYASEEEFTTEDGASIALRRVPIPDGAPRAPLPPVLLVHGIAANHRNQDVHPDYSLARYLAALGRDVWLLTLRSGMRHRSRAERERVRFEAMARYDLPLAVRCVLDKTGEPALDYVGFSMGGMLLYCSVGRSIAEVSLRRVVIMGSPAFVGVSRFLAPVIRRVPRALVPTLPLRLGAHAIAFASEWVRTPLHSVIYNPGNVSPGVTRAALVNAIEDIPAALGADFVDWAGKGGAVEAFGEPALGGLPKLRIPALFVAGTADRIAPVLAVRAAFDAWGAEDPSLPKRFVVVGRDFGHHENYGHGDLVLGAHVGVDLFEPIACFLGPEAPFAEVDPAACVEI
jgi:polyhydroxyalkanoate synthase subunit PhaC